MKRTPLFLAGLSVALAGCGNAVGLPTHDAALQDQLRNPLYAEYYYDDLTEFMVDLALQEDPILTEPSVRDTVDRARTRGLQHAALAVRAQEKGKRGSFISDRGLTSGEALLLDSVLYFGPTFDSPPGPSLSVYLTTTIDPRDGEFPDATAVRVGELKNQYGAQSFAVPMPRSGSGDTLRTAVLWDDELGLLFGFAQLSTVVR
jgi:hypothetical protein